MVIIVIALVGVLGIVTGWAAVQTYDLTRAQEWIVDLVYENVELKEKVKAHETSLEMVLGEMGRES